jgi:cell division protein FtsB
LNRAEAAKPPNLARPVAGAIVLFFVLLLAAAGLKSWRDLEAARQRESVLLERIHVSEEKIERLRHRIAGLGTDPQTLERVAREELGLVKPGDVVIVLPQDSTPAPTPAPPRPPS